MKPIRYFDRLSSTEQEEKVYGSRGIQLLYGGSVFGDFLASCVSRTPVFSHLYGLLQSTSFSRRKIDTFVEEHQVKMEDYVIPKQGFKSFNDFFIRRLKPGARPIAQGQQTAIIPTDARCLFYPNLQKTKTFSVKGIPFNLEAFLGGANLARRYQEGSLMIARLCPSDYHRYHFPVDCTPSQPQEINGALYSVNPLATKRHFEIFWENKRTLTRLQSPFFGEILCVEVGATCVGTIHQTFTPNKPYLKGDEKGYFSFGGSSLVLIFEKNRILFDEDLVSATNRGIEVRCLLGQSMGRVV